MRKPRLTERVLDGLIEAVNRYEADDITDLPDDEQKDLDAASKWLTEMSQWRKWKKAKGGEK